MRCSVRHLDAVEVVHSQDGAPLVLVADEAEAFGLPCLLVSHQVDVDDLSIPDRSWREKKSEFSRRFLLRQRHHSGVSVDLISVGLQETY